MLQLLDELTTWNPFREFDRFLGMNRVVPDNLSWTGNVNKAPVNVYANDDAVKVMVRIPGWNPEWFDLALEDRQLTIGGETNFEGDEAEGRPHLKLNRVVNLPFRVDSDSVRAVYNRGILTVTMQRSELDRAKKIEIASA